MVPSGRSIYTHWVAPIVRAAELLQAEVDGIGRDIVVAIIDEPGISSRGLKDRLNIGHDKLNKARDLMEQWGYIAIRRDSRGSVTSLSVTDEGRIWVDAEVA